MAEYIDREAISEKIRKYYYKNPPNSSYGEGFDRGLDRAQRAILDAPAADVEPVKRGRWLPQIVLGTRVWDCSECKTIGNPIWKRCPVCEAKMNEDVDT